MGRERRRDLAPPNEPYGTSNYGDAEAFILRDPSARKDTRARPGLFLRCVRSNITTAVIGCPYFAHLRATAVLALEDSRHFDM